MCCTNAWEKHKQRLRAQNKFQSPFTCIFWVEDKSFLFFLYGKFRKPKALLNLQFFNAKLVSSTLRTVVVKRFCSPTRFVQLSQTSSGSFTNKHLKPIFEPLQQLFREMQKCRPSRCNLQNAYISCNILYNPIWLITFQWE